MGLFKFLSNREKKKSANIDLAETLLFAKLLPLTKNIPDAKLSGIDPESVKSLEEAPPAVEIDGKKPSSTAMNREIEKIMKQCPTRHLVLEKVIELCGEPETARQRYICAIAYVRGKADYREKAIHYLEMYLANPPYEKAYLSIHHKWGNKEFSADEEKQIHLAEMYSHLGKAYESIHAYNQAIVSYNKELEMTPFYPSPYCRISAMNIRKNQLASAMNILLNAKKTRYYKPLKYITQSGDTVTEDTFRKVIDKHILNLEKKTGKVIECSATNKKA